MTDGAGAETRVNKHLPFYIADLDNCKIGDEVIVTGQYLFRRDHKDRVVIQIRDITGSIYVRVTLEQAVILDRVSRYSRVRIKGRVGRSKDGKHPVIAEVNFLQDLGSLKVPLRDLGPEMREYASRMFVSRVTNSCSALLRDRGFDEFDSKVISSEWVDGGLEPLQVLYPGFGSPASLITSPSAQVMDFLNATGTQRAFTVALSFTSTFRHPNNAAETRVIVAKAVDLSVDGLRSLALATCMSALDRLDVSLTVPPVKEVVDAQWPGGLLRPDPHSTLTVYQYSSSIPTGGASWHSMLLENVVHVVSITGNILVDASIERIGERTVGTLAVYPARFLPLIDAPSPRRQLSDLNEYKSWHS